MIMQNSPVVNDDCVVFQYNSSWYCYVPITKVSSTYLRRALPGQQFHLQNWNWLDSSVKEPVPDKNSMNYLVVLRDPVQRWISGVLEFWCRAYPDYSWQPEDSYDWLFDQVEFDIHTRPQSDFLQHINKEKCTWLWMDNAVETNPWFEQAGIVLRSVPEQEKNRGDSRPLVYFGSNMERSYEQQPGYIPSVPSAQIQTTVTGLLESDPARVERIKQYYQADYDLIEFAQCRP
jgi:hypothetical protein